MGKTKIREISIVDGAEGFSFFKKNASDSSNLDFSDVLLLRRLLSKEKARMLHVLKSESPRSIYDLSKKLGRHFKAVFDDVKLLERIGFIELIQEKTKRRIRHRPVLVVDQLTIHFKI